MRRQWPDTGVGCRAALQPPFSAFEPSIELRTAEQKALLVQEVQPTNLSRRRFLPLSCTRTTARAAPDFALSCRFSQPPDELTGPKKMALKIAFPVPLFRTIVLELMAIWIVVTSVLASRSSATCHLLMREEDLAALLGLVRDCVGMPRI